MCCCFLLNWVAELNSFVVLFGNLNLMIVLELSNMMRSLNNSVLEFSSLTSAFIQTLPQSNSFKHCLPSAESSTSAWLQSLNLLARPLSYSSILVSLFFNLSQAASSAPSVPFITFSPHFHFISTFPRFDFPFTLSASPSSVSSRGSKLLHFLLSSHSSEIQFLKPRYQIEIKYKPCM